MSLKAGGKMDFSFLEQPRKVSFDWHLLQVKKWLDYDSGRELDSVLVYVSTELRIAIERYIFELLYLLKGERLPPDDEQRCRSIKGLFTVMKETDPFYRKTIEFTKMVASMQSYDGPEIKVADTKYLRQKWQQLSEYCHRQLHPNETFASLNRSFQKRGFSLVREVFSRFCEWKPGNASGAICRASMPEEVEDVYNKFVAEEIDEGQARRMLLIMEPVLRDRFFTKKLQDR
jgi:hypothetical protein